MVYEVNQDAVEECKRISQIDYAVENEYVPGSAPFSRAIRSYQAALEEYKRISQTEYAVESEYVPGSAPFSRAIRSSMTTPQKKKVEGDRSLRVDEWVGGSSVEGSASKRRSWKIKD
jgi:hypothetical protein